MNQYLKNITGGPIMSVLGVLIILASIASRFFPELNVDWTEVGIGISIGVAFLMAKDPKKPGGTAALLLFLMLSSCITYDRCLDKYGSTIDSVTYYDTIPLYVPVPIIGDSLMGSLDEVYNQLKEDGDSVTLTSDSGKASALFTNDQGQKNFKFQCPQDTVLVPVEVPIKVDCPPVQVFDPKPPPWWYKYWESYQLLSSVMFALILLALLVRVLIKRIL